MLQPRKVEELAQEAAAHYPDVALPIAMLADCEPTELRKALDHAAVEGAKAERFANEIEKGYRAANQWGHPLGVQVMAQHSLKADERRKGLKSAADLAREVHVTQRFLARPMRIAATALSALVIGGGAAGGAYVEAPDIAPAALHQTDSDHSREQIAIAAGVLGGLAGGAFGAFGGLPLVEPEARRRARKMAKNSQAIDDPADHVPSLKFPLTVGGISAAAFGGSVYAAYATITGKVPALEGAGAGSGLLTLSGRLAIESVGQITDAIQQRRARVDAPGSERPAGQ